MEPQVIDFNTLEATWTAFDRIAHLRPIRNDAEYDRAVALMNRLVDVVGDDEKHPLAGLLDLVGDLVGDHDAEHFAIEAVAPAKRCDN